MHSRVLGVSETGGRPICSGPDMNLPPGRTTSFGSTRIQTGSRCSLVRMILAQALGEYGLVAALRDGFAVLRIRVVDVLRTAEPIHYGMAALALFLVWIFMGRRS